MNEKFARGKILYTYYPLRDRTFEKAKIHKLLFSA